MTEREWHEILARLSAPKPVDLDVLVFRKDHRTPPPGRPEVAGALPPSSRLWRRNEGEGAAIGVRVVSPLVDPETLAARLAAAAIERGIRPIILSTLASTGLERLGFRVERISGGTPEARQACEAELARFWDIAITIDAQDVAMIG